jgi:Fe-S-cluster-containing hydrogenase component 2
LEFCPFDAFSLDSGKLLLVDDKCTNCTACIGVCPTEAISADGFEPNMYVLNELTKESDTLRAKALGTKLTIKCSAIGACLSSFDEQNLITLVMRSSRNIELDMSECAKCPLNEKNCTVSDKIVKVASETNRFLKAINSKKELVVLESTVNDRRSFLKSIFSSASSIKEAMSFEMPENKTKIPLKTLLLKNTLKDAADGINLKITEGGFSFLTQKTISDSCTNCRACVEFCPTNALFYSSDYDKIYFQSGKCVDCSICDIMCKDNSLGKTDEFDLVRFMFDKALCVIEHEIITCDNCKIGFAAKNGVTTCPTCMNFKTDFAGMFLTAEELENRQDKS